MDTGRKLFSVGLLIILTAAAQFLAAEEIVAAPALGSRVTLSVDLHDISVGSPFSLSLLVDYEKPEDVNVTAPVYTGILTLDRFLKTPRILGQDRAGQNRTLTNIEYRFIPIQEGEFTLGAFTITTPDGVTVTQPVVLNVQRRTLGPGILNLQLRWEGAPRQIAAGERATFLLHVNDPRQGSERILYPPPSFFMPQVPRGVLLSQEPLSQQERDAGFVLKLALIPLAAGEFNLTARNLLHDNVRYRIPALRITVTERER